ncbi:MAG TPA: hypothetical protein VG963_21645, partial [Polyangiaceae bacterium]|nr:hypothetical protein [Polyangiaceae bacterium]
QVQCSVNVSGPHCAVTGGNNGNALDLQYTTEADCNGAAGHQWMYGGFCSLGNYTDAESCTGNAGNWMPTNSGYQMTGSSCNVSGDNITMQNIFCQGTGNSALSEQITGLAYVVPGTDGGIGEIRLLSDPSEQVERYWPIPGANGPELYYSVYSSGQYSLRRVTQIASGEGAPQIERQDVLNDFEVYNLQRDPSHQNRVMLDALQFSTNAYVFGSIDPTLDTPDAVQNSLQVLNGVSGKIDTLIILPNF